MVIGRQCRYLESPVQAMDHLAGFTIANDVSERTFQLERGGGQWIKGKSCKTFNPCGPIWRPPTRSISTADSTCGST